MWLYAVGVSPRAIYFADGFLDGADLLTQHKSCSNNQATITQQAIRHYLITMDTTYTKSRCNECLNSLQGMLKRERTSYDAAPVHPDSDYTTLRRSLIEVYDDVFELCHLKNRDTVAVAVSYLDRFMAVQRRFVNVQVAAMTCFYLAVKLYEPVKLPPTLICEAFQRVMDCDDEEDVDDDASTATEASAESIESMEMSILLALNWNLNPPTSMMFVRQLLCCLPNTGLIAWKLAAHEMARDHLEVALKSEETTKYRTSTRAVAALFVATEKLPAANRAPIFKFLLQAVHMTAPEDQREIIQLQAHLKSLVSQSVEEPTSAPKEPCSKRCCKEAAYERPAKKQRSASFSGKPSFTSSPRSIVFLGDGLLA